MSYSKKQVFAARDDGKDPWSVGNAVLYEMCRAHPQHQHKGEVVAKLWLIGKAYSAALDRGRSKAGSERVSSDDFYCERAAPALINSGIDARLADLPVDETMTEAMLRPALLVHGALVRVFRTVTGRSHRSLASKYLHFHRPELFFIYDSRARVALDAVEPASGRTKVPRGADAEYASFMLRALRYRDGIAERFGVRLTPRELDRLFLRFPLPG